MSLRVKSKDVITRKECKCWECRKVIPKGSKAEAWTCVDAGEIFSSHTCSICKAFLNTLDMSDMDEQGLCKGDIWNYDEYKSFREQKEKELI